MRAATKSVLAAGIVVVLALAVGAYLMWWNHRYNEYPWSSYPSSLSWCGRDWQAAGAQTRADIFQNDDDFRQAGDLPGWLNHGQIWTSRENGAVPFTRCRISDVWVRIGSDRFELMALEGGG